MSAYSLSKPSAAAVDAALNYKSWVAPTTTFQNLTGASITVTVTNQNIQEVASPTYVNPPQGTLTIANNAIGVLETPHVGARFSGTGTGTIEIVTAQ